MIDFTHEKGLVSNDAKGYGTRNSIYLRCCYVPSSHNFLEQYCMVYMAATSHSYIVF